MMFTIKYWIKAYCSAPDDVKTIMARKAYKQANCFEEYAYAHMVQRDPKMQDKCVLKMIRTANSFCEYYKTYKIANREKDKRICMCGMENTISNDIKELKILFSLIKDSEKKKIIFLRVYHKKNTPEKWEALSDMLKHERKIPKTLRDEIEKNIPKWNKY